MTQPTFVPAAEIGPIRTFVAAPIPEIGRPKKAGLLGPPASRGGQGVGTPGPDAGFALTLVHRAASLIKLVDGESLHDVEMGIALLASRRAGLMGRAPARTDVDVALDLFGFRLNVADVVANDRRTRFDGLAHSYARQRELIDSVPVDALLQSVEHVRLLVHRPRTAPTH